jgi:mannose-6-phosphate isomerase-like protein (cupin superfamily)
VKRLRLDELPAGPDTVGDQTVEVGPGEILVVPAGVPHKFSSLGEEPIRRISIHRVARMDMEWLE